MNTTKVVFVLFLILWTTFWLGQAFDRSLKINIDHRYADVEHGPDYGPFEAMHWDKDQVI